MRCQTFVHNAFYVFLILGILFTRAQPFMENIKNINDITSTNISGLTYVFIILRSFIELQEQPIVREITYSNSASFAFPNLSFQCSFLSPGIFEVLDHNGSKCLHLLPLCQLVATEG